MTHTEERPILEGFRLRDPAEEFEEYCQVELERLRSSGTDFDEDLYREAVRLVLRKLGREEL